MGEVNDIDRCFDMVMRSEKKYDFIVRIRPDVAVHAPLNYSALSLRKVNYFATDAQNGQGLDWFFVIPTTLVQSYWRGLFVNLYGTSSSYPKFDPPGHVMWPRNNCTSQLCKEKKLRVQSVRFDVSLVRNT